MEYQKIITFLDDTMNQSSKFKTRNLAEINDESRGVHNKGNQIEFKTSMIRSNLCGFSDAYILISGTITIDGSEDDDAAKRAILKTCVSFTECISNINNTEIDNAKDIDVVMPMYKLIE